MNPHWSSASPTHRKGRTRGWTPKYGLSHFLFLSNHHRRSTNVSHSSLAVPKSSSGAINYGDVLAKVSIRPTQHMLDLAAKSDVPGAGADYTDDDLYDPVAIATY